MNGVILNVFIPGRSRTKGSLKPTHVRGTAGRPCKVGMREEVQESVPWKRDMIRAIRADMLPGHSLAVMDEPYAFSVEVHAFFRFDRSHSRELGAQTSPWPDQRDIGDVDKLYRNLLDALTQSGLLADDDLVVGGQSWKRWCRPGEQAGVAVVVWEARHPEDVIRLEKDMGL
jgi:Holliday junction resolvase RusA-like endonuclease